MSSREPSVKFTVTCLQAAECNVAFEPEGAVVAIAQGDVLTVEIRGPGTGFPEVSYIPGGISICAWSGADTFAWDKSGKPIAI
jgi:hypothetical protein